MTYTPVEPDRLNFGSIVRAQWRLTPPPGDWKLPELVGSDPLYALIKLGDTELPIAIDRASAGDKFYSRAWVDADGDGDLAEETPVVSRRRPGVQYPPGYGIFESEPIDLTYSLGGSEYPYRVGIMLQCSQLTRLASMNAQNLEGFIHGYVRGMSTWVAQCEIDGNPWSLTLIDENADGSFADLVSERSTMAGGGSDQPLYTRSDKLLATPSGTEAGHYDSMPLTGLLWMNGGLHALGIDLAAKQLTLEPAEGAVEVSVPADTGRLVLLGTGGTESVAFIAPPTTVKIPAGYYRLLSMRMERTDTEGDQWSVVSSGSNRTPRYVLREGEKTELVYGEPFRPVVTARSAGNYQSADARLELSVRGRGQEHVVNIEHRGNATKIELEQGGMRPKAPTWQAVRPDGERVASGSFEYG